MRVEHQRLPPERKNTERPERACKGYSNTGRRRYLAAIRLGSRGTVTTRSDGSQSCRLEEGWLLVFDAQLTCVETVRGGKRGAQLAIRVDVFGRCLDGVGCADAVVAASTDALALERLGVVAPSVASSDAALGVVDGQDRAHRSRSFTRPRRGERVSVRAGGQCGLRRAGGGSRSSRARRPAR